MDLDRVDSLISSRDPDERREAAMLLSKIRGKASIKRLGMLLADENQGVRDAANESLIVLGGRDVIEAVLPFLKSDDIGLRNTAIDILKKVGSEGIDLLHNLMKAPDDNIRLFIVDILGSIGDAKSVDVIIDALNDINPNVRNAAVVSLGLIGNPKAFEHLRQMVNDEEWIRFSVIEAISHLNHPDVLPFLLEELNRWSDDDLTLSVILEAIANIGDQSVLSPLLSILEDADNTYMMLAIVKTLLQILDPEVLGSLPEEKKAYVRKVIEWHILDTDDFTVVKMLKCLEKIGDFGSAERVIELAQRTDPDEQMDVWEAIKDVLVALNDHDKMLDLLDSNVEKLVILATQVLASIGKDKDVRHMIDRLSSSSLYAKRALTASMVKIGSPVARDAFKRLLNEDDGHVLSYAIQGLGRVGEPDDIDSLEPFLVHKYDDVRQAALDAIVSIDTDKAEKVFLEMVKNPDPELRIISLEGLSGMESDKLPGELDKLLKDVDTRIRVAALHKVMDMEMDIDPELLEVLINDEENQVRYAAQEIAGKRAMDRFRPIIEDRIDSADIWTSYHAVRALGGFKDDRAKARLIDILKGGEDILRIAAANALGEWDDEGLAKEIEPFAEDENPDVARAVFDAMDALRGGKF